MKFYNSLSRSLEVFTPLRPNEVSIYSCGPTVYNYAHIGNLRAFLFSDLLKRYLRYRGYTVHHVMNITDVDDKTIRDSQKAGRSLKEFTDFYMQEFISDLDTLFVDKAERMPRATEEIDGMIEMISQLMSSGHAYQTPQGDVYFKVSSFPSYGQLIGLDATSLKANASGRLNAADEYDKENVQDFALWKAYSAEDGDVFWESPFGKGRPGWHIECSVMSTKYLGQPFDIHTGGVDLKFPHHTNEIAQSECCGPTPFVRYWLHNEHLLVNGRKMSKSEGNFYTLRDLLNKGYKPRSIRLELIKTHYRQHLDFREDNLEGNTRIIERLDECRALLNNITSDRSTPSGITSDWRQYVEEQKASFVEAMDDDLNISSGLAVVLAFIKEVNKRIESLSHEDRELGRSLLAGFDAVLGLDHTESQELLDSEVQTLIDERIQARKEKNFKRADEIRDQLLAQGIELKDTPDGVKFKRL